MKNSILFFSLILLVSLPLTSCSKDENDVSPTEQKVLTNNIVGTWEHFYSDESVVYMIRLEFYANGSYLGESSEVGYGVNTYPQSAQDLTLEQATVKIRNLPWGTSLELGNELGKWSIKDNNLFSVGGFFGDVVSKYNLVNNILIIDWNVDGKGYIEPVMFSKL